MKVLVVGFRESFIQLFGERWDETKESLEYNEWKFLFWEMKTYSQLAEESKLLPPERVLQDIDLILIAVYGDDQRTLILDQDGRFKLLVEQAELKMDLLSKSNHVILMVTKQQWQDNQFQTLIETQPSLMDYQHERRLFAWNAVPIRSQGVCDPNMDELCHLLTRSVEFIRSPYGACVASTLKRSPTISRILFHTEKTLHHIRKQRHKHHEEWKQHPYRVIMKKLMFICVFTVVVFYTWQLWKDCVRENLTLEHKMNLKFHK